MRSADRAPLGLSRPEFRGVVPALTEKTVAGIHFVQEDPPDEMGRAIPGSMRR